MHQPVIGPRALTTLGVSEVAVWAGGPGLGWAW